MMTVKMDPTSTEAVWTEFGRRLRGFIAKRLRNDADVDDVLQDVFARIHASRGGLRDDGKLEAWLFQVARRAVVDHLRRRPPVRPPAAKPEEPSATAELARCLEPLMALIPEEDREALRRDEPRKALAGRTGLSVTAAKSRVLRARRRLREALLACCRVELDRRGNAVDFERRSGSCGCPE